MRIVIPQPEPVPFRTLGLGDVFYRQTSDYEPSASLLCMKCAFDANRGSLAVRLHSGTLEEVGPETLVIPVEGKFVLGPNGGAKG